jgi:hypothetical protein
MPHESTLDLTVLQGLRVKGFAEASALAALLDQPEPDVLEQLEKASADDLVVHREGRLSGWTLTPEGRSANERLLAAEVDRLGLRDRVVDAYRRFLALNAEMLETCTRWQVRQHDGSQVLNDHGDPAYDASVVAELAAIDDHVRPICHDLAGELARFQRYAPRFAEALRRVRSGEHDWFTKPVIESYHTVWFELHEDLLATLGLDRASEAGRS